MSLALPKVASEPGLTGPHLQGRYVSHMEQAYGREGPRFLDAVDAWLAKGADAEGAERLYQVLAKRPPMAAYVSRHQYFRLYVRAADELLNSGLLDDRQVANYGCGFGLLTQLLARLRPVSGFVGVDKPAMAAAARRLAEPQKLRYLVFYASSGPLAETPRQRVVVMVCMTDELFQDALASQRASIELPARARESLSALLNDAALLITINRFSYPGWQVQRLDEVMLQLGLQNFQTDLPAGVLLDESGMASTLPIRVYARPKGAGVPEDRT